MKTSPKFVLLPLGLIALLMTTLAVHAEGEDETAWNTTLKQKMFADRPIVEDQTVTITAPYRAEDPALVPLQITSQFPQTVEKYIKNITVVIDNNPVPFSASFDFTPESGKADIATRMRFNAYTHVRAIAETNDG
ncbi:MAG: thiosulfate oxidation carrier protein SoxY, partial [Methylococcus sp.]